MEIIARASVRVAPRKIRLVADSVRKLTIEEALQNLALFRQRGAQSLEKTLKSAVANAVNNNKVKRESLKIKSIEVQDTPAYKRFHASTRGRVHPYKRRGSNIRIILESAEVEASETKVGLAGKEENGTKS